MKKLYKNEIKSLRSNCSRVDGSRLSICGAFLPPREEDVDAQYPEMYGLFASFLGGLIEDYMYESS